MSGEHRFARRQNQAQKLSQLSNFLRTQTLPNPIKTITLMQKNLGESQQKTKTAQKKKNMYKGLQEKGQSSPKICWKGRIWVPTSCPQS